MSTTSSREELLAAIEQEALELEKTYHGCSRCVLIPIQKHLGLANGEVARASAPLAGGIALSGNTCGALLGGMLAVGLCVADENLENGQAFLDTMGASFRLMRRFQKEFGATTCRELQIDRLGAYYNMASPDEYKEFVKAGGYDVCSTLVGKASRLAAEFLLEMSDKGLLRVSLDV
jgi:C_GCAxxG_C_C family probable redox protein